MKFWRRRSTAEQPKSPVPVLIGHSHSECIFRAAAAAGRPLAGFNLWTVPHPQTTKDGTRFRADISSCLARGAVFSAIGGEVHTTIGMVRHPIPFDFVLPSRPDLTIDPEARQIPYQAVKDRLLADLEKYHKMIAMAKAAAAGPTFHLEAPPPFADAARMYPQIAWSYYEGTTGEISGASLRYKLWRAAMDLTAAFCESIGVAVIPHPPEASDADGFLRQEYYKDPTHATEGYGALVLTQMQSVMCQMQSVM